MKKIFKYELPIRDISEVEIPANAKILSVGSQAQDIGENLYIWALVEPYNIKETYAFKIVGTGYALEEDIDGTFIGTVHFERLQLVLHVWELN